MAREAEASTAPASDLLRHLFIIDMLRAAETVRARSHGPSSSLQTIRHRTRNTLRAWPSLQSLCDYLRDTGRYSADLVTPSVLVRLDLLIYGLEDALRARAGGNGEQTKPKYDHGAALDLAKANGRLSQFADSMVRYLHESDKEKNSSTMLLVAVHVKLLLEHVRNQVLARMEDKPPGDGTGSDKSNKRPRIGD